MLLDLWLLIHPLAISEHWLHDYNLFDIDRLSTDYRFVATSSPREEDSVYCAPRMLRGHGGVALGWKLKWDQFVSPLSSIFTSRMVGVEVRFPPEITFHYFGLSTQSHRVH